MYFQSQREFCGNENREQKIVGRKITENANGDETKKVKKILYLFRLALTRHGWSADGSAAD